MDPVNNLQGVGDGASVFKLHETLAHYVTLQHEMTGQFVGVDNQQNIVPANQVTTGSANSEFEVVLVVSIFKFHDNFKTTVSYSHIKWFSKDLKNGTLMRLSGMVFLVLLVLIYLCLQNPHL